jgi:hypothetical protein
MYTTTVFGKKERKKEARQPTLGKYFKEKRTSGMKCELANEKLVTIYLKL